MLRVVYVQGKSVGPKRQTYKERIEAGALYLMQKWSRKDEAEADEKIERLEKLGKLNN